MSTYHSVLKQATINEVKRIKESELSNHEKKKYLKQLNKIYKLSKEYSNFEYNFFDDTNMINNAEEDSTNKINENDFFTKKNDDKIVIPIKISDDCSNEPKQTSNEQIKSLIKSMEDELFEAITRSGINNNNNNNNLTNISNSSENKKSSSSNKKKKKNKKKNKFFSSSTFVTTTLDKNGNRIVKQKNIVNDNGKIKKSSFNKVLPPLSLINNNAYDHLDSTEELD